MKRVLITARLFGYQSDSSFKLFNQAGIEVISNPYRGQVPTEQQLIDLIGTADGIIPGVEKITSNILDAAPCLKVISRFGTGIDSIDLRAAARKSIVLTKVPEVNSDAVADMAFGLILAIARRIPMLSEKVRSGHWPLVVGDAVSGKTVGIIGLGQIGRKVAMRAKGFNMTILAYEANPDRKFAQENGINVVSLERLLSESDFITLHCPLTKETRHLISSREIEQMKRNAFLINTARGGIIDEEALYTALFEGRISGAASDAFEKEPVGLSPLLDLENFLATPHIAFCTKEVLERMETVASHNLIEALSGRLPENTVDLSSYLD